MRHGRRCQPDSIVASTRLTRIASAMPTTVPVAASPMAERRTRRRIDRFANCCKSRFGVAALLRLQRGATATHASSAEARSACDRSSFAHEGDEVGVDRRHTLGAQGRRDLPAMVAAMQRHVAQDVHD